MGPEWLISKLINQSTIPIFIEWGWYDYFYEVIDLELTNSRKRLIYLILHISMVIMQLLRMRKMYKLK